MSTSCLLRRVGVLLGVCDSGIIQRPVLVHFLPVRITLSLYLTLTLIPNFVDDTLHLASQNVTADKSECDTTPGRIWRNLTAWSSIGISRSPVYDDCIWTPSGGVTEIGSFYICVLLTDTPTTKHRLLTSEYKIAHSLMF
jgi:hypothetical protein